MKLYVLSALFLITAVLPWACSSNNSNPTLANPYPSSTFTTIPTNTPTGSPTMTPSNSPTPTTTRSPSSTPTNSPTPTITNTPTDSPTVTPTSTPSPTATNSPTPTVTSTPPAVANVSAVSFTGFNPSPVTISAGGTVTWSNSTGYTHSVYVDNGAGACATNMALPNGGVTYMTFPSTGTFNYHCQYHSGCGLATCGPSCTGMTGIVVVQ